MEKDESLGEDDEDGLEDVPLMDCLLDAEETLGACADEGGPPGG